jgi:histone deacetylase complex regulatory component SIN3
MDANDFEDLARELFWTSGYHILTVDKVVQSIFKQVFLFLTPAPIRNFRLQVHGIN